MYPLCMNSHLPARKGWQLVCCTGEPMAARMCAKTLEECTCAATSCRLRSFHAGSMLRYTAGKSYSPYQPTPNPSPFVVSAPSSECLLWTIREFSGPYSTSSRSTAPPEYASQRHMETPISPFQCTLDHRASAHPAGVN